MLPLILNDSEFIVKNTTGNNMYSCALKQYRMFRVATKESEAVAEIESRISDKESLTSTERMALIKSRIGQGEFRNRLIKKYDSSCIITGIRSPKLLIASHIKPWAVSSNNERLSEDNGLLLSPTYDRLFDCGLISFSDNGAIYVSSQIDKRDGSILKLKNGDMYNLKINQNVKHNLEYHRNVVFIK
ncbi:MAG: HNH endonuclease [Eubacterium sp.]|nr:HNH endonuclease [Eubacterium sp.]